MNTPRACRNQCANSTTKPKPRLRKYLETRLAVAKDPRSLGRPLQGSQFQNLWRFRVGDYRIIAQIEDDKVRILVLRIGYREVYR